MSQCTACNKPLTVEIDSDDDEEDFNVTESSSGNVVPDSVELACGCFFHWQCLLDAYELTQCPQCSTNISNLTHEGTEQILCNLENEGGRQENLDILPFLKEESYLRAFPEERKCRAFLEFCADGDVGAILDMLNSKDEEDEEVRDDVPSAHAIDVLRYQDPLSNMNTGLHIAISAGKDDIVWLLLFLASSLEPEFFPPDVLQAANTLGAVREDQTGKADIRVLEDSTGRTAEGLAKELGGKWTTWVDEKRLCPVRHQ
ncbi:MAG: hypothetical protein Q9174_003480 [Haloplaca sp. 1 TL-2023]